MGLASELEAECSHCGCCNVVSTCKTHVPKQRSRSSEGQAEADSVLEAQEPTAKRRSHCGGKIYDVNSKAALGM